MPTAPTFVRPSSHIAALVTSRVGLAHIRDAMPHAELYTCSRNHELLALVRDTQIDVVVVEPHDGGGFPTAPIVARLREVAPSLAIVAQAQLTQRDARELVPLARAGITECVFSESDEDRRKLRQIIAEAEAAEIRATVSREAAAVLPPDVARVVNDCLTLPPRQATVSLLATSLGVHRRTLVNRMAASGCLHPGAMLSWSRLCYAARLLEDSWRSVEAVAREVGLADGATLRSVLRRYAGLRPSDIRRGGGLRLIIERFRRALPEPGSTVSAGVA